MKRAGQPAISHAGAEALNQYKANLQHTEDMSLVTIRNYLSDLRQFIAWCEATWQEGLDGETPFQGLAVNKKCLRIWKAREDDGILRKSP